MRRLRAAGGEVFALLLMLAGAAVAAQARPAVTANFTAGGVESCLRCHAVEAMLAMADTPHGDVSNPLAPYAQQGCESCHGPGSLHVSRARGGQGHPPLREFGRGAPAGPQNDACLSCHGVELADAPAMAWRGSLHAEIQLACASCHVLHVEENPLHWAAAQKQVCEACHRAQLADHRPFGELPCARCHEVHSLTRDP